MATTTRPAAHPPVEDWRAIYDGILAAWVAEIHGRLYHDARELYAYYVPSTLDTYGQLLAVADGETPPAGAVLVTGERISGFKTRQQLRAWIQAFTDRLPMLPARPRPQGGVQ